LRFTSAVCEGADQVSTRTLRSFAPTYDPAEIAECVEQLYLANARELADSICEIYERKVPGMLRDIYVKHHEGSH
jgi:hypothetical protein